MLYPPRVLDQETKALALQALQLTEEELWAMIPEIELTMTPATTLAVVGNLQLSLRHPGNTGPNTERVRALLDMIINQEGLDPRIRALLAAGDDPTFDV